MIWRYTDEITGVFSSRKIAGLRRLLSDGAIHIAFQPIWSIKSGEIVGLEALTRISKDYEVSGPEEAFDIADRIGRSFDLDRLCIRTALRRVEGVPSNVLIFLNISPRTLEHADFSVLWLLNEVKEAGIEPEQICIEITERSAAPMGLLKQHVLRMRKSGFKVALDDVGAGNSGLEIMREVNVDVVKIDRSVLVGALSSGTSKGVLMAIVAFAAEAGATVLAEGIETDEMMDLVRQVSGQSPNMSIELLQGYLFARPSEEHPVVFFMRRVLLKTT
jgi:EAL domain-containing protein (putative c-di-GMP-specific phosphodiesterase class I)